MTTVCKACASIAGAVRDRRREFGIDERQYSAMLESSDGKCFICKQVERVPIGMGRRAKEPRGLAIDHDHLTGRVRGLLCVGCNLFMTSVYDNPHGLDAIIPLLKEYVASTKDWRTA